MAPRRSDVPAWTDSLSQAGASAPAILLAVGLVVGIVAGAVGVLRRFGRPGTTR
jgi:hypothetical protein